MEDDDTDGRRDSGVTAQDDAAASPEASERADTRFQKGESGNPNGRSKGSRNRRTILLEAMLESDAQGVLQSCIKQAKAGNATALRLCMERLLPRQSETPVALDLPEIKNRDDLAAAHVQVLHAVADGDISTAQGRAMMALLGQTTEVLERGKYGSDSTSTYARILSALRPD